jgi:hypothetical protein
MAKKKKGTLDTAVNITKDAAVATEHKIEEFASDLGTMLGHARTKAEGWIGQREQIVKSLTDLRDEASRLLSDLGHEAAVATRRGRKAVNQAVADIQKRGPGRPKGSKSAIIIVGGRTKRTMSAAARKAISMAQKKRWAKQKAAAKK